MKLEAEVLKAIREKPRMHITELCRKLNGKFTFFCGRKKCFANPRKKKSFYIAPCVCRISRNRVLKVLKDLEERGAIIIRRERKADGHNNRGWDWMKVIYAIEDLPQETTIQISLIQGGLIG